MVDGHWQLGATALLNALVCLFVILPYGSMGKYLLYCVFVTPPYGSMEGYLVYCLSFCLFVILLFCLYGYGFLSGEKS